MPWTIDHDPRRDVMVIKVTGEMTLDDAKAVTRGVLAQAEVQPTDRVLVDASELLGWMSPVQVLEMIRDYGIASDQRNMRVGVVRPPLTALHEDLRFYETASQNRGYAVRLFADSGTALEWLAPAADRP
jgi:hypothetical protein